MKSIVMTSYDYRKLNPGWFSPGRWAMSEKFDGERAYWTGSSLVSRYGNKIHAPPWWVDRWIGGYMGRLDGELWLGRGRFQELRSIVSRTVNYVDWTNVQYCIFDAPVVGVGFTHLDPKINVAYTLPASWSEVEDAVGRVVGDGGEGVMLRRLGSYWVDKRSRDLVKIKPWLDDVGTVVGYSDGVGRLSGMVGAVLVVWNGKEFGISGFTDAERLVAKDRWPVGSAIRFRYVGLTDDGVPREARFFR